MESTAETDKTPLRIALLLPRQRRLISLDHSRPVLQRSEYSYGEKSAFAAERTIQAISKKRTLQLPRTKIHLALGAIDGTIGVALAPVMEQELNLREFHVKAYDYDDLAEQIARDQSHAESGNPDRAVMDPIDREFIFRAITRTVRL